MNTYLSGSGHPFDGFNMRGPFSTQEEAIVYGERVGEADWWVGELTKLDPNVTEPT